ncbi:MAG: hypothetical protein KAW87_03455 [Candidatus Cloacimonetes bacterium]|nr:hypothetical protein [Candidatus Cloacimonadota bacterium]
MIRKSIEKKERFVFGKTNIILFISALVLIIIGFIILNSATNFGVILLILGYAVLIPISLLIKEKKSKSESVSQKSQR